MQNINSSNLKAANYDEASSTLIVQFRNGSSYKYTNVDSGLYSEFAETFSGENGKSAGKFFNSRIRHLPCEKLEG